MCAIHGFLWPDPAAAAGMVGAARHRGPDGDGVWADHRVTLAHNLLAVADGVAASRQPWHHAGTVLVYNGEVYNYRELRKTLRHTCTTDSDTEVLAAGLVEQGPDFLRKVDGMFALAWYDPAAGRLVLARDPNGARPLYGARVNGRWAFSSEIRSLLALGVDRVVCAEAFRHYWHAGLVAGDLTLFRGVHRFVPGQVVDHDVGTGVFTQFNLTAAPPRFAGNKRDAVAALQAGLAEAVTRTRTGRRRLGLFLSGGLDSGSVLYEMVTAARQRPLTLSSRFELPHPRCRHNEDADLAAFLGKMYGTKHRESVVTEQAWVDAFVPAVTAMEEPRQGKSHPAYYLCNKLMAAFGVVVTLSGDGGDELLAGYKHYLLPTFRERLEALRKGRREPKNRFLRLSLDDQWEYLTDWLPRGGLTGDRVNDFMYAESLHTLAEDFLVRCDKLGAAFGMEARFPMLSRPFADLARSIPGDMKLGTGASWGVANKILLRDAYTGRLPFQVTEKAKTGWRAPTDEWLVGIASAPAAEGPARAFVRETLADPVVRELFEFTARDVEDRYLNNRDFTSPPKASGKPGAPVGLAAQKELFSILTFAVWFKAFGMRLW